MINGRIQFATHTGYMRTGPDGSSIFAHKLSGLLDAEKQNQFCASGTQDMRRDGDEFFKLSYEQILPDFVSLRICSVTLWLRGCPIPA